MSERTKTKRRRMRFKLARARKGLTQGKVAKKLGCTRSHYANIENGHRGFNTFKTAIWSVLGC
jgi:transcriptional regulator with XRE-family HTH domain